MEQFLEESATNILMDQFLQGNVPLRHILNKETLFVN